MSTLSGDFAAIAFTFYVAHHVGDYWIQTDFQAKHKGDTGHHGRLACLAHCVTYVLTQAAMLIVVSLLMSIPLNPWALMSGLLVSGIAHYAADRREHGLMFRLAHRIPGKSDFMKLGIPREPQTLELWGPCSSCEGRGTSYDESTGGKCWDCRAGGMLPGHVVITDNPSLGTGTWALDQSWHVLTSVLIPALLIVALTSGF